MRKKAVVLSVIVMIFASLFIQVSAYTYNTLTESTSPSGYYKTIWGYDEPEMKVGMKLGDKTSDTGKFLTDASIGTHGYDMVVKDDGKGQNGKYAEIAVHGVPNDFSYANPIFDLTRYPGKEKVNDFNGFEEMWIWIDAVGFGDQMTKDLTTGDDIPGFDFSFQLYEQDWKDGKKIPGKFERWAVVDGGEYYIQDGNGWKTLTAKSAMMTTLPQNYKGWLRLPFENMEIVAILGIGNMKLDLNYVVNFTLGIPMDASTIGKTMRIDSIVLYSSKEIPSPTVQTSSVTASSQQISSSTGSMESADSSSFIVSSDNENSIGSETTSDSVPSSDVTSSFTDDKSSAISANSISNGNNSNDNWIIYVVVAAAVVAIAAGSVYFYIIKKRTNSKR